MKIAVIGSGMAGLTAARLLSDCGYEVTVFESAANRGMDAHAFQIDEPAGSGIIDIPLRVLSNRGWRTVLALSRHYGVETFQVTTPIALSWLDQSTWFRSSHLQLPSLNIPIPASPRYLNRNSWLIIKNLWHLSREPSSALQNKTIEDFFSNSRYDPIFWRGLLLPLMLTISTCNYEHLLRYPAENLLRLVQDLIFGANLYRLKGGTRSLVDRLAHKLSFLSGSRVIEIKSSPDGVTVRNSSDQQNKFDFVVVATQANQTSFLGSEFAREHALLNRFVFDSGDLVLHRDHRVMPQNTKDWAVLSYLMDRQFQSAMFSVWVNPVEPSLRAASPLFQTWNPLFPIDSTKILRKIRLERAIVTNSTQSAQNDLNAMTLEPGRRVFFCGSWSYPGIPLLESAARSAIQIVRRIGGSNSFLDHNN